MVNETDDNDEFPLPPPLPSPSIASPCQSPSTSINVKKRPASTSLEDAVKNYLQAQSTKSASQEEDEDMHFFKSLLPMIKKLPEGRKDQLKLEIHSLVVKTVYQPVEQFPQPLQLFMPQQQAAQMATLYCNPPPQPANSFTYTNL
jgi:hypothetical protein